MFPWGGNGTADGKCPPPDGAKAPIVPDTVRRSSRRQHDIEAAKSTHPDLPPSLIPTHATIMVMGESGLGKTVGHATRQFKNISGSTGGSALYSVPPQLQISLWTNSTHDDTGTTMQLAIAATGIDPISISSL